MSEMKLKRLDHENGTQASRGAQSAGLVRTMGEMVQLANLVYESRCFPDVRNPGVALIKMMAGHELGFEPFASLTGVDVVDGKPSVGAHLKAAAIKRSEKYDYEIVEQDEAGTVCEVAFYERFSATGGLFRKFTPGWKRVGTVRFTLDHANEVGLTQGRSGIKDNWKRNPADMLFARCITKGQKRYAPDLSGGVRSYDPDELDAPGAAPEQVPVLAAPAAPGLPEPVQDAEVVPADPTAPPVDTHGPEMANEHQVARIGQLIEDMGFTPAQWQAAFRARGVESARQLTRDQASDMIHRLETVKAKRAEQPAPVPVA